MASSTLDPDNMPESDRQLGKGHGKTSLGPSDLSDSGSDCQGGYHAIEEFDIGLDRGTNEDSGSRAIAAGDDTGDSGGTGEDSTAGRDNSIELGGDIGFDRVDSIGSGQDESELDDAADPSMSGDDKADQEDTLFDKSLRSRPSPLA